MFGIENSFVLAAGLPPPEMQVFFWSLFVFFTLLALLWKFAWGPLMHALEQREHNIQKTIDDADARFKQADAKAAEYEKRINAAKDEAIQIVADGKRDVEKVKEEIIAEANKEATRTLERAKHEITLAKDAAVAELQSRMVDLSSQMAARVIEREVKPDDHRRFISEALQKIEASKN